MMTLTRGPHEQRQKDATACAARSVSIACTSGFFAVLLCHVCFAQSATPSFRFFLTVSPQGFDVDKLCTRASPGKAKEKVPPLSKPRNVSESMTRSSASAQGIDVS